MSPANPGYQAPAVTVSSSLPKRKADKTVLIVPVVSGGDDDGTATVVANPFLDAEAVGEIEVALRGARRQGRHGPGDTGGRAVASGGQRARGRSRQDPRRVAGRPDPARRRGGRPVTERHRGGDHHAVGHRPGGRRRGADPRRLPVQRLPQRQDRTRRTRACATITALAADTKAQDQGAAERATDIATAVATARDLVNTPPSTSIPTNSPSAQRLWVRPPAWRSRCSTTRRWPRRGTAA